MHFYIELRHQFKTNDRLFTNRDSESVQKFLADVGREPMLTIDEEVEIAKSIRRGGKDAAKAKERLVRANLRFVVSVAKAYQHMGMELGDLINEGNIGLMTAADRFDQSRGFKFISYAVWWIRQSITQALSEYGRIVRMPVNQQNLMKKIERLLNKAALVNGTTPTDEEIAEALGVTPLKVKEMKILDGHSSSLDAPAGEDSDTAVSDLMVEQDAVETDAGLIRESLREEIESCMEMLSEKERSIVSMFFGMNGVEMSCGEIGTRLNLTSERVRQIKERAVRRMRDKMTRNIKAGRMAD